MYTIASMLYTFSIWQKSNKIYRVLGIPVILISILDSIIIKSIFGVILQGVVLITSIVGCYSYKKENNVQDNFNEDVKCKAA